MKALALLMPCAMLGALWALQRMEVWMDGASGPRGKAPTRPMAHRPTERARRVGKVRGG